LTKVSGKTGATATGAKARKRVRPKAPSTVARGLPGNAVFLVGFMGAGKSAVGRALGRRLNWVFEDLDDRIAAREGRSVAEIFRDSGESEFRRAEHAAVQQVLEELRGGVARIVALGGGTFAQEQNHKAIQASGIQTIFLDAPLPELWQRCARQTKLDVKRPLQTSQMQFRELHEKRLPFYRTASLRFDTSGKQVEAVAAEIAEKLEALGLKKIAMRTEQGEDE
jgi:shikimate kinase